MDTKTADLSSLRIRTAVIFRHGKDMDFFFILQISAEKFCNCLANRYLCIVIQMELVMGKTVSNHISKGGFMDVNPFKGMDGGVHSSFKRSFTLTSVSKKELEDRRVPVYPYIL